MDIFLDIRKWIKPTPIGGYYYWTYEEAHNRQSITAAIAIENYLRPNQDFQPLSLNYHYLELLDERIDDGSLVTGKLRLGRRNLPLYVLEE